MVNGIYLIVIINEIVESVKRFEWADVEAAEQAFVYALKYYTRDYFESYNVSMCLEDGFAGIGQGSSIQLFKDIVREEKPHHDVAHDMQKQAAKLRSNENTELKIIASLLEGYAMQLLKNN